MTSHISKFPKIISIEDYAKYLLKIREEKKDFLSQNEYLRNSGKNRNQSKKTLLKELFLNHSLFLEKTPLMKKSFVLTHPKLRQSRFPIIGLTGTSGSGKSTFAKFFKKHPWKIFDTDACVHKLYHNTSILKTLENLYGPLGEFPRKTMAQHVKNDPETLKILKKVFGPAVLKELENFLTKNKNHPILIDAPSLFEDGLNFYCTDIVVITAPAFLRKARTYKRSKMPEALFKVFQKTQMPDAEKRKKANHYHNNGCSKRSLKNFYNSLPFKKF